MSPVPAEVREVSGMPHPDAGTVQKAYWCLVASCKVFATWLKAPITKLANLQTCQRDLAACYKYSQHGSGAVSQSWQYPPATKHAAQWHLGPCHRNLQLAERHHQWSKGSGVGLIRQYPPVTKLAPDCIARRSVASFGATPAAAVGGTDRIPGEGLRRTGACGRVRFLAVASAPALHSTA